VLPTPPQATVNVTMPDTTGYAVIQVNAGGNLQTAIDNASCNPQGTIIRIQAGATFNAGGSAILLRNKACAAGKWIIIRSDAPDSVLPGLSNGGVIRAKPSDAANMPTIVADQTNIPGFRAELSANHYRLMFLQVKVSTAISDSSAALIELGDGSQGGPQNTVASQPHDIIVDRCLIRGSDSPPVGIRRGVELQCANCAVVNNYIDQIHQGPGNDAQAVGGWNSTGPWLIDNNYLSASTENILIGGAGITIPGAVPSDITITRNYFIKPLSWNPGDPSYAGTHWAVKNLLELKMGVRVLIEGNIFENVWADAQLAEAHGFYSSNSDGNTPQAWTADVEYRYNKLIRADGGFGGPGGDNGIGGQYTVNNPTSRIWVHDNLGTQLGCFSGRYFGWYSDTKSNNGGSQDTYGSHNTWITVPSPCQSSTWFSGEGLVPAGQTPYGRFAWHNNIVGTQGKGESVNCRSGSGSTTDCLNNPNSWAKNILYGHSCGTTSGYDQNGVCLATNDITGVMFVNPGAGDYRLQVGSPGHNAATDGKDVGADIPTLNAKTAGTVSGLWP
jgi:hypothetical protein